MNTTVTNRIWLSDRIVLDCTTGFLPSGSVYILYDPQEDLITGFRYSPDHSKPALTLIDLVLEASNDYPAPDIVRTDLFRPCKAQLFGPSSHQISFEDHSGPVRYKIALEKIAQSLRRYLNHYQTLDDLISSTGIISAMGTFVGDYNSGTLHPRFYSSDKGDLYATT